MPIMSTELERTSALLGPFYSSSSPESSSSTRTSTSTPKRTSILSRRNKLTELRPKGPLVLVSPASPIEFKKKQHAQAQKQQRDRMKSALDRMAAMLEGGGGSTGSGAGTGTGTAAAGVNAGTKAELVEAAVEYIERLQGRIRELSSSGRGTATDHATDTGTGTATTTATGASGK